MSCCSRILRLLPVLCLLVLPATAQLSGGYTINPAWPPSAGNFQGLNAAVTALVTQGVSGPVVFDIYDDAGPYQETANLLLLPTPPTFSLGNNVACWALADWPGSSATNTVTFRAAAGESPVIDGNGNCYAIYWNGADHTTLEGLEITGAAYDAVSMYTPSGLSALGNTITRCHIHHCGSVGVLTYGNSGPVVDTTISNNLFHDLMMSGGGGFSGFVRDGYVSGRRDSGTRVLHNTFIVNTLFKAGSLEPWVIGNYFSSASHTGFTHIQGNVIHKTAPNGHVFMYKTYQFPAPLPATLDNNDYYRDAVGATVPFGFFDDQLSPSVTVPDLPAWVAATLKDTSSFDLDPQLTGPGVVPFHLAVTSPCISAAGTGTGVTIDFDGDARDPLPDMGCDEYVQSGLPTVSVIGAGCPGTGGLAPALSAVGLPAIGNTSFQLAVNQAPPSTVAYLYFSIGLEPTPILVFQTCYVYLDVLSTLAWINTGFFPFGPAATGPAGVAFFWVPIPNEPALAGQQLDFQAVVVDGGSPAGITITNALDCIVN